MSRYLVTGCAGFVGSHVVETLLRRGHHVLGVDAFTDYYNREVKEAVGRLQAMIEPAMTLILGVILGWVMLSVLGPVYDSISKMKF